MMIRPAPLYRSNVSTFSTASLPSTSLDEAIHFYELFPQGTVSNAANQEFAANFYINHHLPFQHAFSLLVID